MITATLTALALILGYLVAVGLSMAVTFSVAKVAPSFMVKDHLLKTGYKLFQALVWLVAVTVGSSLSALVAEVMMRPWLVEGLLAALLVSVLWANTWEVRQRGLGHQLLMTAFTIAGVGTGYYLALR